MDLPNFRKLCLLRVGIALAFLIGAGASTRASAQPAATIYATAAWVGSPPGYGGPGSADGVGREAQFYAPTGIAIDATGHLYVADANNSTIRKITPGGTVGTLAGLPEWEGFVDGTGSAARFDTPRAVAVAADGSIYVADTFNNLIRKITPTGVVTTLAGMATSAGIGSADGAGSAARFNQPSGIVVDSTGMLYIADAQNHTIRKMTPGGAVSTFAGTPGASGLADGAGAAARFNLPTGIAVDPQGNLYVSDRGSHRIRKVTPAGVVTTLAGSAIGLFGSADGVGAAATFYMPTGIALNSDGTLYVTDQENHTIRKITSAGVVSTVAGRPLHPGGEDGAASAARFYSPAGIVVDAAGALYVADATNHMVRRIAPDGVVTTVAGSPGSFGFVNGIGFDARFRTPYGIAVDSTGSLYIADWENDMVRKVNPEGVVTTLAGSLVPGPDAYFGRPTGTAVDANGNVYVADSFRHAIRKISPSGVVSTLAGLPGTFGDADGSGSTARFFDPHGVCVDASGNVYVADSGNNTIRKIAPTGGVSTFAGAAPGGRADGMGSEARFFRPYGIAVDAAGTVFVADTFNHAIRKITPGGAVTTFAGTLGESGTSDGTAGSARFNQPYAIAIDAEGNAYVADRWNHRIRKITPAGVVTTILGSTSPIPGFPGGADGVGSAAQFNWPQGIAVDSNGILYIADSYNGTIRVAYPVIDPPSIAAPPSGQTVLAGSPCSFSVLAQGSGSMAYQWMRDGVPIVGANGAEYSLPSTQAFHAGNYTVAVTSNGVTIVSSPALLTVQEPPVSSARLVNLSTRAQCEVDDGLLIPGFVLSGAGSRRVLIRGVGPTLGLPPFNLSSVLDDPRLVLISDGMTLGANDDWGAAPNRDELQAVSASVGAFELAPGSKDAALLIDLPAGVYTAPTSGTLGGRGIGIVELYDAGEAGPEFVNISTRGFVREGDAIMIPGFVLEGEGSRKFLLRAVGPGIALPPFRVPGVLQDPVLTVYRGSTPILTNDDWAHGPGAASTLSAAVSVSAFPLPGASGDAACVITLPAGAYTIHVAGKNRSSGIAVVEIYLLP